MKNRFISTTQSASRRYPSRVAAVSLALALGVIAAIGARADEIIVPSGSIATIQDAVDVAAPGDTIRVLPGSYDAVSVFTPGLTLKAETETGPVLVNSFFILAEDVDIEGFNVSDGITLIASARAVLSHNSISAGGVGIFVVDSPAAKIDHNNTVGADIGILLSSSDEVEVDHNTVVANDVGISVDGCSGGNVHHNSTEGLHGIDVTGPSCGNTFAYNSAVGSLFGLYSEDNPSAPCNTYIKNRSATAFPSLKFWDVK